MTAIAGWRAPSSDSVGPAGSTGRLGLATRACRDTDRPVARSGPAAPAPAGGPGDCCSGHGRVVTAIAGWWAPSSGSVGPAGSTGRLRLGTRACRDTDRPVAGPVTGQRRRRRGRPGDWCSGHARVVTPIARWPLGPAASARRSRPGDCCSGHARVVTPIAGWRARSSGSVGPAGSTGRLGLATRARRDTDRPVAGSGPVPPAPADRPGDQCSGHARVVTPAAGWTPTRRRPGARRSARGRSPRAARGLRSVRPRRRSRPGPPRRAGARPRAGPRPARRRPATTARPGR